MRKLLSSIAIAALATTALHADPGGGKGQGGGKDHGNGGAENRGGNGNGGDKQDRAQGGGKSDHGPVAVREDHGKANGKGDRADGFKNDNGQRQVKHDWTEGRSERDNHDRLVRDNRDMGNSRGIWSEYDQRGLVNGCPPGLAKKHNGCMPPGQAKKSNFDRYDRNWWGLRGLNNTSGYRYIDGNLVRLSSNGSVLSYYPLLGGALSVGNPWPSGWQSTPLAPYYANYYGLDNDSRYYDGAIYNVAPGTSIIQKIAALLTGDTFNVGQRMPSGYDAYNVPYQYRNQYADGPNANYRYSDGYVYQTDPKTQLILAAIKLLT